MAIAIIEGRQAARLHKLHNSSVAGLNLSPIPWPTLTYSKSCTKAIETLYCLLLLIIVSACVF